MGIETAILGAVIAGGASMAGSAMTNSAAQDNADAQMKFQNDESSTAHQREVADLKAAGLNPILSAGGSGASSPSGVSAPVLNTLGDAASAGITNYSALQGTRQIDPLIDKVHSETKLNNSLAIQAAANATSALSTARLNSAKTSEEHVGLVGHTIGSSVSDVIDHGLGKLKDVISGINLNSAAKIKPYSSTAPRPSTGSSSHGSWSPPDAQGTEHILFN